MQSLWPEYSAFASTFPGTHADISGMLRTGTHTGLAGMLRMGMHADISGMLRMGMHADIQVSDMLLTGTHADLAGILLTETHADLSGMVLTGMHACMHAYRYIRDLSNRHACRYMRYAFDNACRSIRYGSQMTKNTESTARDHVINLYAQTPYFMFTECR